MGIWTPTTEQVKQATKCPALNWISYAQEKQTHKQKILKPHPTVFFSAKNTSKEKKENEREQKRRKEKEKLKGTVKENYFL